MNSAVQKYWLQLSLQREAPDPCICHLDLQVLSSDTTASATTTLTRAQRNRGFQMSYSATDHDMFKQHWLPQKCTSNGFLLMKFCSLPAVPFLEKISGCAFLISQSSIFLEAQAKHQPSIARRWEIIRRALDAKIKLYFS